MFSQRKRLSQLLVFLLLPLPLAACDHLSTQSTKIEPVIQSDSGAAAQAQKSSSKDVALDRDAVVEKLRNNEYDFSGLNLDSADLSGLDLATVDFNRASLVEANFTGASLVGAVFDDADLTRANFTDAQMLEASFMRATTDDVILNGAKNYEKDDFPQEVP